MPKTAFRREILEKRLLHQSSEDKHEKDKKILCNLEDLKEFKDAEKVLFYAPIHGEVDTFKIIKRWTDKKEIFLPRTNKEEHRLEIHKIDNIENLKKGAFGITEPHENTRETDPRDISLVIIPGIAFDPKGHRIGFGLGYYDRLLKKTNCPKVGLAYEFQIIENVPGIEPNDVPVDIIVTEKRIINTQQK